MDWKNPVFRWLLVLLAVILVGVLFLFDPHSSSFFPPCPLKSATGWECPGCGSTRAMHLLLHGRILEALGKNPLMVVSIPVLLAMLLWPAITRKPWVAWSTLIILVTYGIIRNIPVAPFTLLAP